jgi:hypothetical protein
MDFSDRDRCEFNHQLDQLPQKLLLYDQLRREEYHNTDQQHLQINNKKAKGL